MTIRGKWGKKERGMERNFVPLISRTRSRSVPQKNFPWSVFCQWKKILLHIKDCSSCRGNAQGWPWKRSLARKNVLACFKKSISMLCWKVSKCRSWKGTYVVQNLFLMNNALITFFLLSKRAARIRSFFSPTHPLALFLHFFTQMIQKCLSRFQFGDFRLKYPSKVLSLFSSWFWMFVESESSLGSIWN